MGKAQQELARSNIFINADVKEWYREESAKMGVSMSALMAMALYQFKEQKEMILRMESQEFKDMVALARNELEKEGRV